MDGMPTTNTKDNAPFERVFRVRSDNEIDHGNNKALVALSGRTQSHQDSVHRSSKQPRYKICSCSVLSLPFHSLTPSTVLQHYGLSSNKIFLTIARNFISPRFGTLKDLILSFLSVICLPQLLLQLGAIYILSWSLLPVSSSQLVYNLGLLVRDL